jgi:uncharacterized membrane protein
MYENHESSLEVAANKESDEHFLEKIFPTTKFRRRLSLILILLLAAILRFYQLDGQSMWFDEAARMIISKTDLSTILLTTGGDTLPPFFHATIHFWRMLGETDFWLRLLPAFASLLLVATMMGLALSIYDYPTAAVSGILLGLFPYQIFVAQQANLYSYLALFSGLQILLFWLSVTRNGKWHWVGYGFFALIAWYTHYFGALVTITLNLWLLLTLPRQKDRWQEFNWRPWLLTNSFIIVLSLPAIFHMLDGASDVAGNFWLNQPNFAAPIFTLFLFFMSYSVPPSISPIALLLVVLVVALAIVELIFSARRKPEQRPALWLLLSLTFLPMILVLLASLVVPLYLDRTLIIVSPAFALILSRAIVSTRRKSPLPYLTVVALIIMLFSLGTYYWDQALYKPDYRAASAYVASQLRDGQAVVHTGNGSYIPFLFYQGEENHFLLAGDPAPHHPPKLHELVGGRSVDLNDLGGYESFWLVVALEHSVEYQRQRAAEIADKYPLLGNSTIDEITIQQFQIPAN